jgi:hypothetical protein
MAELKTYTLNIHSEDRLDVANTKVNNATFNLNLSQLLPRDVEYWKVQMYFCGDAGYYTDLISAGTAAIQSDYQKGQVYVTNLRSLSLSSKNNGKSGFVGYIKRETTNLTYVSTPATPQVANFIADNSHNPPITIMRPDDALLNIVIYNDYGIPLVTTSNQGVAQGDMTGYNLCLSFTPVQDYKETATFPPKR